MDIPRAAFAQIDHRPWPVPTAPWIHRQRWLRLLFAHWPASIEQLRPLVPRPLTIQAFDGSSWVGIVPFQIVGLSGRGLPDLPGVSAFPEVNLRLYVEADGQPGIWFISLDAASRIAVSGARAVFQLPYFHARMSLEEKAGALRFRSQRRGDASIVLEADYTAVAGRPFEPSHGSLEHFLTERYCLYLKHADGGIRRMQIQHPPWKLQPANAQFLDNTLASGQGVVMNERVQPLLHYCEQQDVVGWWPERIGNRSH